jgi:hypothetical protein
LEGWTCVETIRGEAGLDNDVDVDPIRGEHGEASLDNDVDIDPIRGEHGTGRYFEMAS